MVLEYYEDIDFDILLYLIGEIHYGGYITDKNDKIVLESILGNCLDI